MRRHAFAGTGPRLKPSWRKRQIDATSANSAVRGHGPNAVDLPSEVHLVSREPGVSGDREPSQSHKNSCAITFATTVDRFLFDCVTRPGQEWSTNAQKRRWSGPPAQGSLADSESAVPSSTILDTGYDHAGSPDSFGILLRRSPPSSAPSASGIGPSSPSDVTAIAARIRGTMQ